MAWVVGILTCVMTSPVIAADGEKAEIRPSEIKKGQDFAPAEQRVSIREAEDYRRSTGILARAKHEATLVDTGSLYERRLGMYSGRKYNESLMTKQGCGSSEAPVRCPAEITTKTPSAWGRILALSIPTVLLGVFLIWWCRQMKQGETSRSQIVSLREGMKRGGPKAGSANGVRRRSCR